MARTGERRGGRAVRDHKGTIRDRLKAGRAFAKGCLPRAVPEASLADARGSRQFRRSADCLGRQRPRRAKRLPPSAMSASCCRCRCLPPLDYLVPEGMAPPEPGSFVRVPLGVRSLVGVVWEGAEGELPVERLKPVVEALPIPPPAARAAPLCRARRRLHDGASRHGVAHDDECRRGTGDAAPAAGVWLVPGGARGVMRHGP